MHKRCKIVLHDHLIKNYQFAMLHKKVGCSGVMWRKIWLLLGDSVKLFCTVSAYSFFSYIIRIIYKIVSN
jgi:hypothetical protein